MRKRVIEIFSGLLGNMREVNFPFLVAIAKHFVNKYKNNYTIVLIDIMGQYGMPMIIFDFRNIFI